MCINQSNFVSFIEVNNSHSSNLLFWTGQHAYFLRWTQTADAFGVLSSFNNFYHFQVLEIIHINLMLKNDSNSIYTNYFEWMRIRNCLLVFSQFHSFDFALKIQLSDALHLRIVPQHDFVRRVFRTLTSSDQSYDVRPIEHLHNTNASIKFYQ